jgi:hypothetical protein
MSGGKWRDYRQVLCQLRSQGNTLRLAKPFLGLPIIYQEIKGAKNLCFTGTLEPAQSGRMASPVILKPIALQGGRFGALIVVMQAPKPDKIRVNRRQRVHAGCPDKRPRAAGFRRKRCAGRRSQGRDGQHFHRETDRFSSDL